MPKSESQQMGVSPRVWLAVIGKHPGWNDHLDDIGLETERLVAVKRHLYVDGIGGAINSGAWEALGEEERDNGFAHTFFWRQPDGVVIGRMWSSSDGKGRQKYPMIACAMCRSLPFSFVAGPLLERLRRLEHECKEASTASAVIGAADRTRAEIRELASFAPETDASPLAGDGAGPGSASALIGSGRLGENGVGLKRVLYQMDREMGAYIRPEGSGTASRSRSVEVRGQHIRVPAPAGTVSAGDEHGDIGLWIRLILTKIDPLVPVFATTKDGRDWVDLIVGELGPTPLACLQSTTEAIPFVSDIPFTLDDDVDAALTESIDLSNRGEVVEKDPCYIDVPQDRLAPFLRPKRTDARQAPKGRTPLYLIVGAIVVLVLVVVALLATRGNGNSSAEGTNSETRSSQRDPSEEPSGAPRPSAPQTPDPNAVANALAQESTETGQDTAPILQANDTTTDEISSDDVSIRVPSDPEGRRDLFLRWCDRYESWYGPFLEAWEDRDFDIDPDFASGVEGAIATAAEAGDALDPLIMTPGRFRSLDSLRQTPPDSIYDPDFAETIAAGIGPIEAIRLEFSADRWKTRDSLARVLSLADDQAVPVPGGLTALLVELDSDDGAVSAEAAARLASMTTVLETTSSDLDEFQKAQHEVAACPAVEVSEAFEYLTPFPTTIAEAGDTAGWIRSIGDRAQRLSILGMALLTDAQGSFPRVDPGLFATSIEALPTPSDAVTAKAFLEGWLAAVRDRSLYLLDPETDPRRTLPGSDRLSAVGLGVAALNDSDANAESRELAGMFEAYQDAARSLDSLSWNEATKDRVTDESASLLALFRGIVDRIDAEERKRALKMESYIAGLRATDTVSATGSAVIDAAWVAARDESITRFGDDIVGLSRAIDDAREHLARAEAMIPPVEVDEQVLGKITPMLAEAVRAERARVLAELVPQHEQAGIDLIQRRYESWLLDLRGGIESLGTLRDGVAGWVRPADRTASERWAASWGAQQIAWQDIEPGVSAYAMAVSTDESSRLAQIAVSQDAPPGARFVAWCRLDETDPEWGSTGEQLGLDQGASDSLIVELQSLPADRADEVRATIVRTVTARWLRGASVANADTFPSIAAIGDAMPLDQGVLPPAPRFNLFIDSLRRGLRTGETLDRASLVSRAHQLREAVGPDFLGRAWLDSFVDELSAREGREVDYRVVGPARAGWAVEPFDSGRVLRYSWSGGDEPRELTFRLVESPEAGVFYLCEIEAPAWLMTHYALRSTDAAALEAVLPEDWAPIPDTRLGPHVWDWGRVRGGRGIRVSRSWVTGNRRGDRPYYADGFEESVGRPSDQHPIQRVSSQAAAVIAASAGCRLPTASEWRAAYAALGSPSASADWNLRDRAFETQRAHTVSLGAAIAVAWPDQQSFGDGLDGVPVGANAVSHDWSDDVLWFSETAAGRERPFRHLVGNVAEYVLPGTNDPALLTDRGGPVSDRVGAIGAEARSLGVIGGSSLSAPSVPCDRVVQPAVETGKFGYTDVGFRLAFSPGVEAPLVVVVSELLADAPFLRMSD